MVRLPRKRKKQVKKLVARKTATKIAMSAMVSAQTMAQSVIIGATPHIGPAGIAAKALSVAQNVASAAKAIQSIMLEPPNSWRDFVKMKKKKPKQFLSGKELEAWLKSRSYHE